MNIGTVSGANWDLIGAIYLGLLLFGIGYNHLTAWLERNGYSEGYTAYLVVGGVGVTVAATSLLSMQWALVTAGAFAASGLPMVLGSMWRYMQRRREAREAIIEEARR